jgi:hypothetical protein
MFGQIKRLFTRKTKNRQYHLSIEEKWLAQSDSLQEVEKRQRMIQRGEAPWQRNYYI